MEYPWRPCQSRLSYVHIILETYIYIFLTQREPFYLYFLEARHALDSTRPTSPALSQTLMVLKTLRPVAAVEMSTLGSCLCQWCSFTSCCPCGWVGGWVWVWVWVGGWVYVCVCVRYVWVSACKRSACARCSGAPSRSCWPCGPCKGEE